MGQDRYIDAIDRAVDNAWDDAGNYDTTTSSAGKVMRALLMPRGKWLAAANEEELSYGNETWNQQLKNSDDGYELIKRWSKEAVQFLVDDELITGFDTTITELNTYGATIVWAWHDKAARSPYRLTKAVHWGS